MSILGWFAYVLTGKSAQRDRVAAATASVRVVESVHGNYFYHLAPKDQMRALCDPNKRVMGSSLSLSGWGHRSSHLREKYCQDCAQHAREQGVRLGQL